MKSLSRLVLLAVFSLSPTMASVRAAEVEPLLPAESESVVMINVRQVLESELFKKYARGQVEQALQGNDAQKMMKDMGLDPMKDIEKVMVGTWGTGPEDMKFVFVIRGKFDPAKLFEAVQQAAKKDPDKVEIVSEGDFKLIKFTPENERKPVYASVASENAIVAGSDKKLVAATLADAQKGANKPRIKKELADLVAKQDEKVSMFAVGLTDGKIELPPNFSIPVQGVDPEKLEKQLQGMKTASMIMNVTDGVSFELAMGMKDTDTASDFGKTIEQLLTTAKVFIPILAAQQPQFQPVAQELGETLKSTVDDKSVSISLKITGGTIAKAVGAAD